ncbi:MAG: KAP family NTPase [Bacteroidota bacterium]|nr:KAP family NTPase [Bacteroidota bacterium]
MNFYVAVAAVLGWSCYMGWLGWRLRQLYQQSMQAVEASLYDADTAAHGKGDQPTAIDSLKLGVAPVVANLLRHPLTTAPYTVALSGGWGSGKSSVMEQIKKHLWEADFPFNPIYINIWHFQQEDQLLTWFLSRILACCNTGWFRWRQLGHRLRTLGFARTLYRALVLSLAFPVLLFVLVALAHGLTNPTAAALLRAVHNWEISRWVAAWFRPAFYVIGHLDDALRPNAGAAKPSAWAVMIPGLSVLFAVVTLVGSVGASLKSLPGLVRPLLDLIPYQQQYEVARGTAGFRQRYQQDFATIIQNAKNNNLVIFVDDIDRVSGPRVLELLETLNFIINNARNADGSSKGAKLYFILAMNVPEVVRVLAPVLDPHRQFTTQDAREQLAASYLAKLVDLTVRIPSLRDRDITSLS